MGTVHDAVAILDGDGMLVVMVREEMAPAYLEAIRRGFNVARELDQRCGPVHLLVGVADGDGPAAAALEPGPGGRSLRAVVTASWITARSPQV